MKLLLTLVLFYIPICLLSQETTNCDCKLKVSIKSTCYDTNSTFKVLFKNGTSRQGAIAYKRLEILKNNVQNIQVCFQDNSSEIYNISDLESFVYSSIGPGCDPIIYPIRPSSIYYLKDDGVEKIEENYDVLYFDLLGGAIYDFKTSNPNFKTFLYGGEALIGYGITRDFSIALGASAVIEGSRNYFPIKGELRYHLFVDDPTKKYINYKMKFHPSHCALRDPYLDTNIVFALPKEFKQELIVPIDLGTELDSTVYWVPDIVVSKTEGSKYNFKPYIYAEGGIVLDGEFDGSGKESDPPYITINPEEYSEFMFGIGVGAYIWDYLHASIGYRYMRLNYREPCKDENCFKYAIYTNDVMGAYLRIGLHLGIFK